MFDPASQVLNVLYETFLTFLYAILLISIFDTIHINVLRIGLIPTQLSFSVEEINEDGQTDLVW